MKGVTERQGFDLWHMFPAQMTETKYVRKCILGDLSPPGKNSIALPCGSYVGRFAWEKKQTLGDCWTMWDTYCGKQFMVLREQSYWLDHDCFYFALFQPTYFNIMAWKSSIVINTPCGVCKLFRWRVQECAIFTGRDAEDQFLSKHFMISFCLLIVSEVSVKLRSSSHRQIFHLYFWLRIQHTTLSGFCFEKVLSP